MKNVLEPRQTNISDIAGLRFLVVDDYKFSRQITTEVLKSLNANNISEAADASEAIKMIQLATAFEHDSVTPEQLADSLELSDDRILQRSKFDCVITDYNMLPLNGIHLLKAIRSGVAGCKRDMPVLMLTGCSHARLINAAIMLDISAYVLKPISRQELSEKLCAVLMRQMTPQSQEKYGAVPVPEFDSGTDVDNL